MTWNLSNKIAACSACAAVASRNGFHMSITASRMRALCFAPSQAGACKHNVHPRTGGTSPPREGEAVHGSSHLDVAQDDIDVDVLLLQDDRSFIRACCFKDAVTAVPQV